MSNSDWIESAGGPLVIIPRSAGAAWRGIASDDYADACAIEEYVGVVRRAWGDVVVLGDEPLRTAVVYRAEGPSVVRWMYAPGEEQILRAAQEARLDVVQPVHSLKVDLIDEPYIIFDSGGDGGSAEAIAFIPSPQARVVNTYVIKDESNEVGMILHTFTR